MSAKLYCYNRGCGQEFDPDDNTEESCCHHPGVPYFHDAYKGWTCCNKKSVDFTEFLNIRGCYLAKHSNEKPTEPEKEEETVKAPAPKPQPIKKDVGLKRPPFDTHLTTIVPTVSESFRKEMDSMPAQDVKRLINMVEEISIGTKCKNSGCETSYESPASNDTECIHHSGVPIFHEGMKYWSCCQRKTSDFTAFMSQKGCSTGRHRWIKEGNIEEVKCRWDWHQTGRDVVVSVYAKLYDYKCSFVKINPIRLNIELVFPQQNNNKFIIDMELRGIVKVETASVKMLGTKVEIVLTKAELGSWPRLEIPVKKEHIEPSNVQPAPLEESDDSDVDLDDLEAETGKPVQEITSMKK